MTPIKPMTIEQLLNHSKEGLASVTDNPRLEAEILLAYVLNKPRSYLHAWPERAVSLEDQQQFMRCLERRYRKEPIAYITGTREFWSLDFLVTPATLIPRPETELLVELTLKLFVSHTEIKIADLGTGSGVIALALAHEHPSWELFAVDASEAALQIARKNAEQLGISNVNFFHGDWCEALPCRDLDAIVSNPPYIGETEWTDYADDLAFEPRQALISGEEGLDAIRMIIRSAKHYLKPGGYVLIEHGFLQAKAVHSIFASEGYNSIHSERDIFDKERVTLGRYLSS